jgi:peroxiredoxin
MFSGWNRKWEIECTGCGEGFFGLNGIMAETLSTFELGCGDLVPRFELEDAWGKVYGFVEVAGERGTLVVFACNHCPFVVHLARELGEFASEYERRGVRTVAIVSNDLEKYPDDGPEGMKVFANDYGWNFPYLLDETQDVARAYGAACTPDFFLTDGDGRLVYMGQFDGTRPRSGVRPSGEDLRRAVEGMLAGEDVGKGVPSSGCGIKWKG